jgi:plasmid stabilization system protein ParE
MTYRVVYSPRSRRDIEHIRSYLAAETADAELAQHFIERLLETCDTLRTLPERFATYPHAPRWKMMPVGNYLVFFHVHENEVRIGHIRHAARRPLRS